MTTFAVLATGPSMSQDVADSVRGKCSVVAVSDAWQLAPWADALVSADAGWWRHHKPVFEGKRYTLGTYPDTEKLQGVPMGTNSGLLGIHVAVLMGATKVLLLGVDLHGTHFFGPHLTLRNTRPERTAMFHRQFAEYKPKGVTILNCNSASRLTCYPMARLEEVLNEDVAENDQVPRVQCVPGMRMGTDAIPLRDHENMSGVRSAHRNKSWQNHSSVHEDVEG